jgi:hypothetical protein
MKLSMHSYRSCNGFVWLVQALPQYWCGGLSLSRRLGRQTCCRGTGAWEQAAPCERRRTDGAPPRLSQGLARPDACPPTQVPRWLQPAVLTPLGAPRLMDQHAPPATRERPARGRGWRGLDGRDRERTLPGLPPARSWPTAGRGLDPRRRLPARVGDMPEPALPGPQGQRGGCGRSAGWRRLLVGAPPAVRDPHLGSTASHATRGHAVVGPQADRWRDARARHGWENPGPVQRRPLTGTRGQAGCGLLAATSHRGPSGSAACPGGDRHLPASPEPHAPGGRACHHRVAGWVVRELPGRPGQPSTHPVGRGPHGWHGGPSCGRPPASARQAVVPVVRTPNARAGHALDRGRCGAPGDPSRGSPPGVTGAANGARVVWASRQTPTVTRASNRCPVMVDTRLTPPVRRAVVSRSSEAKPAVHLETARRGEAVMEVALIGSEDESGTLSSHHGGMSPALGHSRGYRFMPMRVDASPPGYPAYDFQGQEVASKFSSVGLMVRASQRRGPSEEPAPVTSGGCSGWYPWVADHLTGIRRVPAALEARGFLAAA